MAPILQSPNTNLALFLQNPKCYFGTPLLQSPNIILALILQSPNIILAKTITLCSKAQMLVWQNFTKTQISLSSILGNILSKAQMLVWQNFYKYSKAQVLPLAIFWKNCTKPKYYHWQYFIEVQCYFGNILSTTLNYYFFWQIIIS